MDQLEKEIREKLKNYVSTDIGFLKEQWRKWISLGGFDLIEKKTGANPQVIYDILKQEKIKSIRKTKYVDRYAITIKHSLVYEIEVIIVFDSPNKGDIGVVTYYKYLIK